MRCFCSLRQTNGLLLKGIAILLITDMNSDMGHVNCDIILITDMSSDMCHVNCDIRLHNIMAIPKHFVWNKVGDNNH